MNYNESEAIKYSSDEERKSLREAELIRQKGAIAVAVIETVLGKGVRLIPDVQDDLIEFIKNAQATLDK